MTLLEPMECCKAFGTEGGTSALTEAEAGAIMLCSVHLRFWDGSQDSGGSQPCQVEFELCIQPRLKPCFPLGCLYL